MEHCTRFFPSTQCTREVETVLDGGTRPIVQLTAACRQLLACNQGGSLRQWTFHPYSALRSLDDELASSSQSDDDAATCSSDVLDTRQCALAPLPSSHGWTLKQEITFAPDSLTAELFIQCSGSAVITGGRDALLCMWRV
jgi:hypothetical protein